MESRLSQRNRDTTPIHAKDGISILHFTADLMRLADANQRFHASPSDLDNLSDIRDRLAECKTPLMYYGSESVHSVGTSQTHGGLIIALSFLLMELKARNAGMGQRDIMMDEIEHIRILVKELDQCRKRTVFYR